MKKRTLLALALIVCLLLVGCHTGDASTTTNAKPSVNDPSRGDPNVGNDIAYTVLGSCNVTYTVNVSKAQYITSAESLPNYDALKEYDDAWFAEHALLVILETVPSGKISVGIESIKYDADNANITLTHTYDGTLAIATNTVLLVWAEVPTDLSYNWNIVNPALESSVSDT